MSTASTKPRRPSSGSRTHKSSVPLAVGVENNENGGAETLNAVPVAVEDPPIVEPLPPAKTPMAIGRSLEITCAADVSMELLIDKLKLLEYEREFCRKKKPYRKPLSRAYFAAPLSAHSNEQYYYFANLAAWLLTLAGVETPGVKEQDDPNLTNSSLITAACKLGFGKPSYLPPKLITGYGKEVCGFLEGLVDYVLERKRFSYKQPIYKADQVADDQEVDDADDTAGMEGADEMAGPAPEDYEEEAYMEVGRNDTVPASSAPDQQGDRACLVSKVDPTQWKLELERVAPKLRITINVDSKDWRNHLDEAHNHQKTITSAWPDSKVALERMRADLGSSLEKLQGREKFLNDQFENLMQQYKATRLQLGDVQETYNKRTESVADRNSELSRISEQNEEIKHFLDERGSNIADATPVVRIKGAIKKLSEELHEMQVRIGVVSNTLLQLSLKNKRLMQSQAALLSDDDD